ncbi:hypothetical protein G5B37_13980 [Rasiella rasia]|uniref:Uncharacterized protein n=1 Tax=Rasiella rasia TaxID=2744027 RepID=A0A6G6GSE5_9FLAO|nr:hypothetical protein [Rasiella rasia]QIE60631.1 hypothetical protein G5B37_13980 [Rasiella rasia]
MKKFGAYILILVTATVVIFYLLDAGYTYVYNNGAYRSKAMWVRDMKDLPKLDYIVLGSSRANYFINPTVIEAQTGKMGLNLGVNASTGIEIFLMLDEFLKIRDVDTVFIQVDSKYIQMNPDLVGEQAWIPFIYEPVKYELFKDHGDEYIWCRYMPFYRYQRSEARLGYRNVIPSLLGKGVSYKENSGYFPKSGVIKKERPYRADKPITQENPYFKMMIELCEEKNVPVIFFTAPIYGFKGDLKPLQKYLPNYYDLKESITDRNLFSDQTHLNTQGATVFSRKFATLFFNNAKEESSSNP